MLISGNGFNNYSDTQSELVIGNKVSSPFVSIVIPTYKRPELLKESIESALEQYTEIKYEVIVVDNDDDEGEDLSSIINDIKDDRLAYYKNKKNIGLFGNWNRCIELAKGEWVCLLNDDDILLPIFLDSFNAAREKMEFDAYSTCVEKFGSKFVRNRGVKSFIIRLNSYFMKDRNLLLTDFLFENTIYGTLGVIFNRESALSLNGFDETMYPSGDYDFWVRWLLNGKSIYRDGIKAAKYRVEVNESLKLETRKGFIKEGYKIKKKIIGESSLGDLFLVKVCGFHMEKITCKKISKYRITSLFYILFSAYSFFQTFINKLKALNK